MMVKITIDTNSAAFMSQDQIVKLDPECEAHEVCRILETIIAGIRLSGEVCRKQALRDINGNIVGIQTKTR